MGSPFPGPASKFYRNSIETLSKFYRNSIEILSKFYRNPIEILSKFYRISIEILSKSYRNSIEIQSKFYRNSIEILSKFHCCMGNTSHRASLCKTFPLHAYFVGLGRHVLHMGLIHMGLLIHDRALDKIMIFPGTPVMY